MAIIYYKVGGSVLLCGRVHINDTNCNLFVSYVNSVGRYYFSASKIKHLEFKIIYPWVRDNTRKRSTGLNLPKTRYFFEFILI